MSINKQLFAVLFLAGNWTQPPLCSDIYQGSVCLRSRPCTCGSLSSQLSSQWIRFALCSAKCHRLCLPKIDLVRRKAALCKLCQCRVCMFQLSPHASVLAGSTYALFLLKQEDDSAVAAVCPQPCSGTPCRKTSFFVSIQPWGLGPSSKQQQSCPLCSLTTCVSSLQTGGQWRVVSLGPAAASNLTLDSCASHQGPPYPVKITPDHTVCFLKQQQQPGNQSGSHSQVWHPSLFTLQWLHLDFITAVPDDYWYRKFISRPTSCNCMVWNSVMPKHCTLPFSEAQHTACKFTRKD